MADFDNIKPGLSEERALVVEASHSVSHTGKPVLSTPMMISLMESVAMHLVQPFLPPGYTTVGYEVNVKHKEPAPVGTRIRVYSKLLEADGRKLLFAVRVIGQENVIGEGLHRRTIIQIAE